MFNSLTGTITGKFQKQIFLYIHGIEWNIIMPEISIDSLPALGNTVKIYTWLNHTENTMDLYGFSSIEERILFFDLIKVDGIGAKGAIKIMSNISCPELIAALDNGELSVLEKVQGIGKKTAAKMMLTLKGKLTLPENTSVIKTAYTVVAESLCNMGYDRKLCDEIIAKLELSYSADKEFNSKSKTEKEDIIFKKALLEMAK